VLQVVVRVRPVLPAESEEQVAVSVEQDGARVQVCSRLPAAQCCGNNPPSTAHMVYLHCGIVTPESRPCQTMLRFCYRQVQLPAPVGKDLLPGTQRMGGRSYGFDACLPGSTTQVGL
jgi:hypothetical protein